MESPYIKGGVVFVCLFVCFFVCFVFLFVLFLMACGHKAWQNYHNLRMYGTWNMMKAPEMSLRLLPEVLWKENGANHVMPDMDAYILSLALSYFLSRYQVQKILKSWSVVALSSSVMQLCVHHQAAHWACWMSCVFPSRSLSVLLHPSLETRTLTDSSSLFSLWLLVEFSNGDHEQDIRGKKGSKDRQLIP